MYNFEKEKTEKIVEELGYDKYTYDYPIPAKDVEGPLGTCIPKELPKEIYTFMRLYRMEVKPSRPSVEYGPVLSP